jgi:hypothetical protein
MLKVFARVKTKLTGILRSRPTGKKMTLIFGLAVVGLALLYLAFSLLAVSRGELKLAELKKSWQEEEVCHEDCSRRRRAAADEAASALAVGEKRTAARLEEYFRDDSLPIGFREELVALSRRAYAADSPPQYISDYWSEAEGEPRLRAAILGAYNPASRDYYFSLLSGSEELPVKREALRLLSADAGKDSGLSPEQLMLIKNLALDPLTPVSLRAPLVLLAGDYYKTFSAETIAVWKKIYAEGDEVSRAFAANRLNELAGEEIAVPPVSQEAWDEYYNN